MPTEGHQGHAESPPTLTRLGDTDRTVSSSDEDIRGRLVKDKDGLDLGEIHGLMVDAVEGKVRFMEVASGGFLGFGESTSFIPVEAITRITADTVQISHTRAHVAGAPRYDPSLVAADAHYFFNLYPYYGYMGGYLGVVTPPLVGYPFANHASATTDSDGSADP
jgi:sporulation protein YlmC with PRC-barrel domain